MKSLGLVSGASESGGRSPAQIAVIRLIDEMADLIARQYPQVAADYRVGLTQAEIAAKYSIDMRAGIRVAKMAVGKALQTLIPDVEEREHLAKEKRIKTGMASPLLTPAGLSALRRSMQHCLSGQGKTPWITSLVDPVSGLNEPDYILSLASQQEFIRQSGKRKGHPDCFKISDRLNEVFHQRATVRSAKAVSTQLARLQGRQF